MTQRNAHAEEQSAYAEAGVNIAAAQRATTLMAQAVKATYGPEVLSDVGAFGGLYDAGRLQEMAAPVLVASTDGVGTKTKVAARLGRWRTIGHDIVNHCLNDILVQGARPLFFLDYVASSHLDAEQIAAVVTGVADACGVAGCVLLGGETAEMPGVYQAGELDLVGTIVGVVERGKIIDGRRIQPGDVILGLSSTGLHTNGYSLARHVLGSLDWNEPLPEVGHSLAEMLLAPHRSYLEPVQRLWQTGVDVRGLAHITGGGLVDNPPRIFPPDVAAVIRRGSWPEPSIFALIQHRGQVSDEEMFHVFNMGLGMLVIVPAAHVSRAREALDGDVYVVGAIVAGQGGVEISDK
jgi:phosphoribosylformylglycinamidine cyclo-ligase